MVIFNHYLLVLHGPVYFVVVTGAQIDHDVLVAKEEHNRAGVIQLVHFVEVWKCYKKSFKELFNFATIMNFEAIIFEVNWKLCCSTAFSVRLQWALSSQGKFFQTTKKLDLHPNLHFYLTNLFADCEQEPIFNTSVTFLNHYCLWDNFLTRNFRNVH